jgi:hypothetical protein
MSAALPGPAPPPPKPPFAYRPELLPEPVASLRPVRSLKSVPSHYLEPPRQRSLPFLKKRFRPAADRTRTTAPRLKLSWIDYFFCSFCDVFFLERATLVTADHVRRWKNSCQLKPISERRIAMKVTKTISNEKLASVCGTAKGNCTRTRVPMKVNVTA